MSDRCHEGARRGITGTAGRFDYWYKHPFDVAAGNRAFIASPI